MEWFLNLESNMDYRKISIFISFILYFSLIGYAQNAPIAKPLETDFLFMCHKLGCRTAGPNIFKILSSLTVSNLGNNLLITFLIISVK